MTKTTVTDQLIERVSKELNLKLSDEQKAILKEPNNQALLVNACAGSGKTTILVLNIIIKAIAHEQNPNEVLAVTFSKKAQLDMKKRYKDYSEIISQKENISLGMPTFKTFHALFLMLLTKLPKYKNATVWSKVPAKTYQALYYCINLEYDKSKYQTLENMFRVKDYLINTTYSYDGINLNQDNDYIHNITSSDNATLGEALKNMGFDADDEWIESYQKVVNTYSRLKKGGSALDFNDIQLNLKKELDDKDNLKVFKNAMSKYKRVYLDEFQDINALQWNLLTKILSENVLDRLFVIGDDDQSIYGFRGSSPYFITHFTSELVPSAKELKLSTNYRTAGNILNYASLVIKQNKSRLNKTIKSYKKGIGKFDLVKSSFNYAENKMLEKLVETIKSNKDETIAILTRYSFGQMIIRDYLSENGICIPTTNKSSLLQSNRMFQSLYGMLSAISNDDLPQFIAKADIISNRRFQKMLWATYYKQSKPQHDIVGFLTSAKDSLLGDSFLVVNWRGMLDNFIKEIKNYNENLKDNEDSLDDLWQMIQELSINRISYLVSNNIVKKYTYLSVYSYLDYLIDKHKTFDELQVSENAKVEKLVADKEEKPEKAKLGIYTIHKVKGLEFDNVFVIGLINQDIDEADLELNKALSSDYSFDEFKEKINKLAVTKDEQLKDIIMKLYSAGVQDSYELYWDFQLKSFDCFPRTDRELKIIYHAYTQLLQNLEEERRLIYVAITRAKKRCYVEKVSADLESPLIDELEENINEDKSDIKRM